MSEQGEVMFGNTAIAYGVVRSGARRKTVTLSVSAEGLEVRVPEGIDSLRVQAVVLEKADWVIRKQMHVERLLRNAEPPRRFVDGESLRYLGRQYRLKRVPDVQRAKLKGRYFEVPYAAEDAVRATLLTWYKEKAACQLPKRVEFYGKRLGQAPSNVLIRDQKKRWGSCNSKGELRFNWRIVMAPLPLLDYVVAHELCHLEHLNHSPEFWHQLKKILPDYRQLKQQLDVQGNLYRL